MNRLLAHAIGIALALPPLPLLAADPPPTPLSSPTEADTARAKELFETGRQLFLDGSYEAAVAAFRESYQLSGDPILLYNIFQCYDRLEDFDAAIEYVEHYRAFAPASERDALAEQVESLRRRKLKAQTEAEAEAEKEEGAREETRSEVAPISDRPPQKIYTPLAIAFTAVAAVGVGVGIGLGVAAGNRKSDAADLCMGDPLVCPMEAESDVVASRNLGLGANISFAIAGAAAIGLITVLAVNASKRRKQGRVSTSGNALRVKF